MGIELERRYLVLRMDQDALFGAIKREIQQGYFEIIDPFRSFRVRIEDNRSASLTFKRGSGYSRDEDEIEIDIKTGYSLLAHCSHFIQKTRYIPKYHTRDGVWTIDIFKDPLTDIVITEFEHEKAEQEVKLPPWIHEAIEITDSVSNLHLARLATEIRETGKTSSLVSMYGAIMPKRIRKIVLTGGPCSGKSRIMAEIKEKMGKTIQCVPEVATILISQVGIKPETNARRFNDSIYNIQKIFEATSLGQAADDGKTAVVFDRGILDLAAYLDGGLAKMESVYKTKKELEYSQYDLVICLTVPPKKIYDEHKRNNPARRESYEEAIPLGERIKAAWAGHPNFRVVTNEGGWEEKTKTALKLIEEFIK